MRLARHVRPVAVVCAVVGVSACGVVQQDQPGFESLAQGLADIPLEPSSPTQASRPAVRVEVMSPHALWDARDGALPVPPLADINLDPPPRPAEPQAPPQAPPLRILQLGAFSSREAAGTAWAATPAVLNGYTPIFEPVVIDGRALVRLKVALTSDRASEVCRAAGLTGPDCG